MKANEEAAIIKCVSIKWKKMENMQWNELAFRKRSFQDMLQTHAIL